MKIKTILIFACGIFFILAVGLLILWLAHSMELIDIEFHAFEPAVSLASGVTAILFALLNDVPSNIIKRLRSNTDYPESYTEGDTDRFPSYTGSDTTRRIDFIKEELHSKTVKQYQKQMQLHLKYGSKNGNEKYIDVPIRKFEDGQLGRKLQTKQDIIEEAERGPRVIIGAPGSGKTILIQQIFFTLLEQYIDSLTDDGGLARLPLYIELRDRDCPTDFNEMIEYWWERSGIKHHRKLPDLIKDGMLFLILDGLNELPDMNRKKRFSSIYNGVHPYSITAYEGAIILSCRIADYADDDFRVSTGGIFQISSLETQNLVTFADTYLKNKAEANEFLGLVADRPERVDLTSNILALKMLKDIYLSGQRQLPRSRPELYERYVDELYAKAQQTPKETIRTEKENLKTAWQTLAYRMMIEDKVDGVRKPDAKKMSRKNSLSRNYAIDDGLTLNILTVDYDEDEDNKDSIVKFFHRTMYEHLITQKTAKLFEDEFSQQHSDLTQVSQNKQIKLINNLRTFGIVASSVLPTIMGMYLDEDCDPELRNTCRHAIMHIAGESRSGAGIIMALYLIVDNAVTMQHLLTNNPKQDVQAYVRILTTNLDTFINGSLKETFLNWRAAQLSLKAENGHVLKITPTIFDARVISVTLGLEQELEHRGRFVRAIWNDDQVKYDTPMFHDQIDIDYRKKAERSFLRIERAYDIITKDMADPYDRNSELTRDVVHQVVTVIQLMMLDHSDDTPMKKPNIGAKGQKKIRTTLKKLSNRLYQHTKDMIDELSPSDLS